jgi:hypothetical protein
MTPIELTGYVDENHQLRVEVPHDIAPGPIKVFIALGDEDPAAWGRSVLQRWAEESNDGLEDVYTLEDGVPYRAQR